MGDRGAVEWPESLTRRMGDVAGRKESAPHYWNYLLLCWSFENTGSCQKLKTALSPAS